MFYMERIRLLQRVCKVLNSDLETYKKNTYLQTIEDLLNLLEDGSIKTTFIGWLGGHYDDFGFYDDKKDAERAYQPSEKLDELFEDFKEKKVKITIEELED